jgi:hypothetical protein
MMKKFVICILHGNISRMINVWRIRRAVHVARIREMRNAYTILVGNTERKISIRRLGRRWEDNIKIDLGEMGYEGVDFKKLEDPLPCSQEPATDFILSHLNQGHTPFL